MSKRGQRSDGSDNPRDWWRTPPKAADVLARQVAPVRFWEPAAGDYALAGHMAGHGWTCAAATDIDPRAARVRLQDGATLTRGQLAAAGADVLLTNPPYRRALIVPLLAHWLTLGRPVWLLLETDFAFNQWFAPFAPHVGQVVAVGRLQWIEGTRNTSTANFAWFCLQPRPFAVPFLIGQMRQPRTGAADAADPGLPPRDTAAE